MSLKVSDSLLEPPKRGDSITSRTDSLGGNL